MSITELFKSLDPIAGVIGAIVAVGAFLYRLMGPKRKAQNALFEIYVVLTAVRQALSGFKNHTLNSDHDTAQQWIDEEKFIILKKSSLKDQQKATNNSDNSKVNYISSEVDTLMENIQKRLVSQQSQLIKPEVDISEYVNFVNNTIDQIRDINKSIYNLLPFFKKINLDNRSRRKIAQEYPELIFPSELSKQQKKAFQYKKTVLENESELLELERQHKIEETINNKDVLELSELNAINEKINSQGAEIDFKNKLLGKPTYVAEVVNVILEATGHQIQELNYSSINEDVDLKTTKDHQTYIIRCSVEPVSESSLIAIIDEQESQNYDEAIIITDNIIEPSAARFQERFEKVEVKTIDEFLRGQFYLEAYLQWLISGHDDLEIGKYNVDLSFVEELETSEKNHKPQYSEQAKIKDYLNRWLQSGNSNRHYTILGDYGSGKSWFCWYYAINQLDQYQKNPVGNRFPILIRLKEYRNFTSWEDIFELFCERFKITKLNFDAFQRLNALGRFLIIFDGFDELFTGSTSQPAIEKFYQLNRAAPSNSKVLLTSRTTFFRSIDDESSDLNTGGLPLEQRVNLDVHPNFKKLILKPFEPREIENYLRIKDPENWKESFKKIKDHPNLFDLARRPILLQMITATLPELKEKKEINVFDLYQKYTEKWIKEAGVGRTERLLKSTEKYELMKSVAWEMYINNRLIIETTKLDMILSHILPSGSWVKAKSLLEEIKGHTFLVTNDKDTYSFAHKSFLEFFVSIVLANKTEEGDKTALHNIDKPIEKEILDFLNHTNLNTSNLAEWLLEKNKGESNGVFNGNVINLLRTQDYSFLKFDFSDLDIHYANFGNYDVTGANFRNTTLVQLDARDATLDHTDFTNARFESLILGVRSSAKYVTNSIRYIAAPNGYNEIELFPVTQSNEEKVILKGHKDSVANLEFNSTGNRLASAGFDRSVLVWDIEKREEVFRLTGHHDTVYGLCFSRDSKYLISGDNSHTLKFWDAIEGKEVLSVNWGHSKTIYSIDYHPKIDLMATGSFDKTIGIWSLENDNESIEVDLLGHLNEHEGLVNHVSFSPDGKLMASASNDKTVILWDIKPDNPMPIFRERLKGHEEVVWSVFFSPDSKHLASGGSDNMIRIWNVETHELIKILSGHEADVWTLTFSKDGKNIVSGSFDSTVKVWDWQNQGNKIVNDYSMAKDNNLKISCQEMILSSQERSGLSTLQLNFLTQKGASVDEH